MKVFFFFLLLASASAEEPGSKGIHYVLKSVKPANLSQYKVVERPGFRQFLEFQNESGSHFLIYEEVSALPPMREIAGLRQFLGQWDTECNLELDCKTKAFCTGDCHNMYYEFTNAPGDPQFPERNNCNIDAFSCEKKGTVPVAAAASQSEQALAAPAKGP